MLDCCAMKKASKDNESSPDPAVHSKNIQRQLTDLVEHLREDIEVVDDPRFAALLETSAEVVNGLKTAFAHYDQGRERAWRG